MQRSRTLWMRVDVTRIAAACAVMSAIVIPACSDSTGPGGRFHVTVLLDSLVGPSFAFDADSSQTLSCTAFLRAGAAGSGMATWGDATFRLFAGRNRSTPVDSAVVPASTVQAAWGEAGIQSGEIEETAVQTTSGIPFSGDVIFRYTPQGGSAASTRVGYTCGPTPTANSLPPVITALSVQPAVSPVQPGGLVNLGYTETSTLGLWQTIVTLSGPCSAQWKYAEQLQKSVSRVVSLQVPQRCRLGMPLTFSAAAVDAAEQQTARSVAPGITLVDATPPEIQPLYFPPLGGSATDQLAGDYFVDDSLYFIFNASDNYALRSLVWEVTPAGFRDSLLVSGTAASPWLKLPVRPDWVGPLQLRLYARDSVGLSSDTVSSAPGSVVVYPTLSRPTQSTTVNGEVRGLAIDQRRGVVYLMQTNQQRLAVLSIATMSVVDSIPITGPTGLDLSLSGDSLLLALPVQRALGVVDLTHHPLVVTLLPLSVLDTSLGQYPVGVTVASNGKAFLALDGPTAAAHTLMEVDLGTKAQLLRPDAGGDVTGVERSGDRTTLVVNGLPGSFHLYDALADTFSVPAPVTPDGGLTLDATGQQIAIGVNLYDRSLRFVRRVHSPIQPPGSIPTVFSGDGLDLYQGYLHSIIRSRLSDGAMLDRALTPVLAGSISVSPDGTQLIIVDSDCCTTSRIAVMDMR